MTKLGQIVALGVSTTVRSRLGERKWRRWWCCCWWRCNSFNFPAEGFSMYLYLNPRKLGSRVRLIYDRGKRRRGTDSLKCRARWRITSFFVVPCQHCSVTSGERRTKREEREADRASLTTRSLVQITDMAGQLGSGTSLYRICGQLLLLVKSFKISHSSSLVLELFWALLLSLVHISNVSELRIDGGVINPQNTSSEMTPLSSGAQHGRHRRRIHADSFSVPMFQVSYALTEDPRAV